MIFFSIYKRLKNDFTFLEQYGYKFEREAKNYVKPAVEFCNLNKSLLIGYAYDKDKFFVTYFDNEIKEYLEKSNLIKIQNMDPIRMPLFSQGYPKPFYIVDENTNLLGKSYKEQLQQVKQLLNNFLLNS